MNKDEVLKKSKNENAGFDERELRILKDSFGFGAIAIVVLCCMFIVFRALKDESFFEFSVIIFAYLAASNYYQYKRVRNNKLLISAIGCLLVVFLGFTGYFFVK